MTLPCAVYMPLSSSAAASAIASMVRARSPMTASAAATIPATSTARVTGADGIWSSSVMYDSGR
jgi:hypothetical protein